MQKDPKLAQAHSVEFLLLYVIVYFLNLFPPQKNVSLNLG